jgi:hypothetical protein
MWFESNTREIIQFIRPSVRLRVFPHAEHYIVSYRIVRIVCIVMFDCYVLCVLGEDTRERKNKKKERKEARKRKKVR